jgi:hypothetical protein
MASEPIKYFILPVTVAVAARQWERWTSASTFAYVESKRARRPITVIDLLSLDRTLNETTHGSDYHFCELFKHLSANVRELAGQSIARKRSLLRSRFTVDSSRWPNLPSP